MTSQVSQFQRTGLPCTILFVDVCGSTQIYETLGNARAQAIIAKTLDILSRSAKQAAALEDLGIKSLAVRVGFHSGPVIAHAADVFGDTVNVAARVVAHAKPGQILVAKQTVRRLPKEGSARYIGSTQVKGKAQPIELFEIVWDHENLTMVKDIFEAKAGNARLTASFGST